MENEFNNTNNLNNIEHNNNDKDQKICLDSNEQAWNEETYNAWVKKFGTPKDAFNKISKEPTKTLSVIYDKMGEVKGKKIMNVMGSNGTKAVALALLGADVSVVDFSQGNKRYAMELAEVAGVKIHYILSNVLNLTEEHLTGDYDVVFAEIGILHYFTELKPFIQIIYKLLGDKGRFVLRDFHPVTTKLITSRGTTAKIRKHKVTGDYFDTSLEEKDISYSKYLTDTAPTKVLLRKWNMGEIITAIAEEGFLIKSLDEEPNLSCEVYDKGIPKTFSLVAEKRRELE